jgi:hypothetical protein
MDQAECVTFVISGNVSHGERADKISWEHGKKKVE